MSLDQKNILRIDLQEVYHECQRMSAISVHALYQDGARPEFHPDFFVISDEENEVNQLHSFAMEGASMISNHASMVKHYAQTGIDALTYYKDLEKPTEADSHNEDDKTVEDPDGNTILTQDINNNQFNPGQKLVDKEQDIVLFSIENLPDDQTRYTVVQQFIKSSLIHYCLYKWWQLKNLGDLSMSNEKEFYSYLSKVKMNAIHQQNIKNIETPQKTFYGL